MAKITLQEQIKKLESSIITKGIKQFCASNLEKVKKLQKLKEENGQVN